MTEIRFRNLRPEEIQVRPTDTKYKGKATLLLYQDARVGMEILDYTVGPMNWAKEYYEVAGVVYCKVGIRGDDGIWVWKSDCGSEGNIEAEKSTASDAFKRTVVNWGIGRELYNTPKIRISCPDTYYYNDKLTMTFYIKKIEWVDGSCSSLVVCDRFGNVVYDLNSNKPQEKREEPKCNCDVLKEFCSKKKGEEGVDIDDLTRFYRFYEDRCIDWNGNFDVTKLFQNWEKTKRT